MPVNNEGRHARVYVRASALICLLLFVAIQGMSVCRALHKAVHADASTSNHHCLITLLSDGKVEYEGASLAPPGRQNDVSVFLIPLYTAECASICFLLPPGRAPPWFSV